MEQDNWLRLRDTASWHQILNIDLILEDRPRGSAIVGAANVENLPGMPCLGDLDLCSARSWVDWHRAGYNCYCGIECEEQGCCGDDSIEHDGETLAYR